MKINPVMKYKLYFLLAFMLLSGLTASSQQVSDSKTFKKSFRVGKNPALDVSNKYGNIHISHTTGDSVSIMAEITATSANEARLEGMMSDVEISLTMTGETVRAQTLFGKKVNALFESFKGLTKNIINYESRLQINYFITCPPSTTIRLANSYGDVYIGEETPELTLTLSNGSLDADKVSNALSMNLTFCKAEIRSIEKGRLSISYGELRAKEAGVISLTSRSSKVRIEKARELDLDSKRDDVVIGECFVVTGTTYFSDLIAEQLNRELSLVTKYGNLSCNTISEGFSLIDISSSYTDVDLSMDAKASYGFEIRHTDAFVSLPGVSPVPEKTEISAENKVYLTSGNVGSSPDKSRIRIDATKGEIRLVQK